MTVIDTSVILAAVERRNESARRLLGQMVERSHRSFVVAGELEFGVRTATTDEARRARERSRRYYQLVSEPRREVDLDELNRWFGLISAVASIAGLRIGQNDRWIVAEAAHVGAPLWTADEAMHRLCVAVSEHPDGASVESVLVPST